MRCGFHLAGLPHHDIAAIARPLADMGYHDVAVRIGPRWNPGNDAIWSNAASCLKNAGLGVVIDADGLFMTDVWNAHSPSLAIAGENETREVLLSNCIARAAQIASSVVTFSVGCRNDEEESEAMLKRVADSLVRLVVTAERNGVTIAIKPFLGSAIETSSHFDRLLQWLPPQIGQSDSLGWAADIACMARRGELPIGDRLERDATRLKCIYLSDIAHGQGGDQRFGHGELSIHRIIAAIDRLPFDGPVIAKVEGHGDAGLAIAKEAIELIGIR